MTVIDPAAKLFGHLPRLAELQAAGSTTAPINAEIDLSNRCSLGCVWCHFSHTHTRGPLAGKAAKPTGAIPGGDLMDYGLALRIIRQLPASTSITWTGGGEPTLHPQFDDLVAYTALRVRPQAIYTHGGHIDAERAQLLKQAMTFVYVSLDAADAASYQAAKGVNRWPHVMAGIQRLVAATGPATIGLGYLVTADNYQQAGQAADMARDLGVDYIQFRPTIHYAQDTPDTPAEDTTWLAEARTYLAAVTVGRPHVIADLDRFDLYRHWVGHGYRTCWWSQLQTCITPNGHVWVCVNKREHPAALVGDLATESFDEIWARHQAAQVDGSCRVMCRGHLPNLTLDSVMQQHDAAHAAFV